MASRAAVAIAGVAVVVGLGAAGWYWWKHREPPYLPPPPAKAQATPATPTGPKHPIVPEAGTPPLPALKDSDGAAVQAGIDLIGQEALQRFFNLDTLVRNLVVTVDNLP